MLKLSVWCWFDSYWCFNVHNEMASCKHGLDICFRLFLFVFVSCLLYLLTRIWLNRFDGLETDGNRMCGKVALKLTLFFFPGYFCRCPDVFSATCFACLFSCFSEAAMMKSSPPPPPMMVLGWTAVQFVLLYMWVETHFGTLDIDSMAESLRKKWGLLHVASITHWNMVDR